MAKRELRIAITGDTSSLDRAFAKAGKGADRFGGKLGTAAKVAAAALGGGLVIGAKKAVEAFAEAERVAAQTNAVLKSTGGVANVTAKQVSALAGAISRKSGIDDEAIQSGQNMLLTFTKVRNEVGRGNDIFDRASQTVTDFSVTFKKDLAGSAVLVGKALNDPIKGLTSLARVGVQFDAGQRKQIKSLVESGRTLDAQKVILKELEVQTKGAAEAYGNTFSGKLGKAKTAIGNLGEAIGGALVPPLADATQGLADFVTKLTTSDRPAKFFSGVGDAVSGVKDGIQGVIDDFGKRRKGGDSLGSAIGGSVTAGISEIDWGKVGDKLSEGFEKGVDFSGKIAPGVTEGISTALGQVDGRKLLGGLLRVVSEGINALFSPSFWKDNFSAILSTVTVVIPVGKILKVPGFGWLYDKISRPLFGIVGRIGKGLGRLFGRMGSEAFRRLVGTLSEAPGVAGAIGRLVGKIPGWLKGLPGKFKQGSVAGIASLADGLVDGAGRVGGAVGRVIGKIPRAIGRGLPAVLRAGGRIGRGILNGVLDAIKGAPGAIRDAIMSIIPKGLRALGKIKDLIFGGGRRKGGKIKRYFEGGRVPILASGGELYVENGRAMTIPGRDDRDGTPMMAKPGAAVLTYDGQARMAAGASMGQALATQAPHFMSGGRVARHMRKSGFKGQGLITGLAVSKGESGWNERAVNRNSNGSVDRGLFQINSIHGKKSTFDPQGNTNAAWSISSRARNWNPWVVFKRGLHRRHLKAAVRAAAMGGGKPEDFTGRGKGIGRGSLVPGVFGAAYEAAVGGSSYSPVAAAMEAINRRLGDRAPRASSGGGGSPAGLPGRVQAMLRKGKSIAAKGYSYSYGGGHNGSFSGPYDCSGLVSAILHAGGALSRPMAVVQPMAGALQRGKGKHVTVGMRGSSGKSAHCMMKVGGSYFESANRLGKTGYRKGWSGKFNMYHPKGFGRGGVVSALRGLRTAKPRRVAPLLKKLTREMRGATPRQMFGYLGIARKNRSVGSRAAVSVIQGALGAYAGQQAAAAEATVGGQDQQTTDFTNQLIVSGGDPESAAGQKAILGLKGAQLAQSQSALSGLVAARAVAAKAGSKSTVADLDKRIKDLSSLILAQRAELVTMTKEANQPLVDAIASAVEAQRENTAELAATRKSIEDQTKFAQSVTATQLSSTLQSLVAYVSGDIAGKITGRGLVPTAPLARY